LNLDNKVIAITGAAQGLGLAMASDFSQRGATVILLDTNEDILKISAEALEKQGAKVAYHVVNVTNEEQVESVFSSIKEQYGCLHGLVNSAGIMRDGILLKAKDGVVHEKMSLSQFQSVLDVNVTGTFLCAREAAAVMVETDSKGVIVNISSVSRAGNMGQTNYSASKAAVATMTVTWGKELARYGIRTGCIAPGLLKTAMVEQMRPEMIERFLKTVPVGRFGSLDELSQAARFIFENDYFTGRTLELDGGVRI
jgi:3-oxoacyl-[acyl-carrier protein] reductase